MPDTDDLVDISTVPSFGERIAVLERTERRRFRRRRLVTAVLALIVTAALVAAGVREYRHRFAPASVQIAGNWLLQEVDHDGRSILTAADLVDYAWGVPAQFTDHGTFLLQGGCAATTGKYRVTLDILSFRDAATPAVACGYATADAERVANATGSATDAVLQDGAVVSTPGADLLVMTVDDGEYVLHYTRDPSPDPGQLLP